MYLSICWCMWLVLSSIVCAQMLFPYTYEFMVALPHVFILSAQNEVYQLVCDDGQQPRLQRTTLQKFGWIQLWWLMDTWCWTMVSCGVWSNFDGAAQQLNKSTLEHPQMLMDLPFWISPHVLGGPWEGCSFYAITDTGQLVQRLTSDTVIGNVTIRWT